MDFYINRGSTLPHLKVKIFTGNEIDFESYNKLIKTAKVTFSMKNLSNNVYKIAGKPCDIIAKHVGVDSFSDIYEYYIVYEWSSKDTNTTGSYIGEFNITFKYGTTNCTETLLVPIKERLYVFVIDSLTK